MESFPPAESSPTDSLHNLASISQFLHVEGDSPTLGASTCSAACSIQRVHARMSCLSMVCREALPVSVDRRQPPSASRRATQVAACRQTRASRRNVRNAPTDTCPSFCRLLCGGGGAAEGDRESLPGAAIIQAAFVHNV